MASSTELTVNVKDLAPVKALLADLALLHRKSDDTIEIEVYDENDDYTLRHIHICNECGHGFDDGGEPIWLEWPCRTARKLGLNL